MRQLLIALLIVLAPTAIVLGQTPGRSRASPGEVCGEVVALRGAEGAELRFALSRPGGAAPTSPAATLLLLPGGSGHADLDARGCPQALRGNSLVRSIPHFNALGFTTALVDAPSTHHGEDGLGGYRASAAHARDLALIVADLRARLGGAVWVVGTSRGTISAVNLGARGQGAGAPDGVVLTSILTVGDPRARKPWVAQSVFDHPLESIATPVLLIGHVADDCIRSPASQMESVARRLGAARRQIVVVAGGPGGRGLTSIEACEGRSPHGFIEQEREVAEGIGRFVRGGRY
ncbi:MAG: hypothetical protein JNK67_06705 [Alphaproteobacteria bacterium]|nr:hypothetical protein [Alphaproteobacteria bacterium]